MKDGKLFGKFNIIDIIVLIVILILVVGTVLKHQKFDAKITSELPEATLIYQFLIENVRDYTVEAFQVGDNIYDSQSGILIGKIVNVESGDAKYYETTANGKLMKVANPYRYDITLTIETPVSIGKEGYYANKSIDMRVNCSKLIETRYAKTYGTIRKIEVFK